MPCILAAHLQQQQHMHHHLLSKTLEALLQFVELHQSSSVCTAGVFLRYLQGCLRRIQVANSSGKEASSQDCVYNALDSTALDRAAQISCVILKFLHSSQETLIKLMLEAPVHDKAQRHRENVHHSLHTGRECSCSQQSVGLTFKAGKGPARFKDSPYSDAFPNLQQCILSNPVLLRVLSSVFLSPLQAFQKILQ